MGKIAKDTFSSYHPIINFIYFAFVILTTIFVLHPVLLALSLISGISYAIYLGGKKALKLTLLGLLPMMIVAALFNPLFNHAGATILGYSIFDGNPITLESIYFGLAAAAMLGGVVIWFACYNMIMSSDKFVYLFGRFIPVLSLIFSMVLRFIPKYQTQAKRVAEAQRCIGKGATSGKFKDRLKNGAMIFSIMITWALENGVETADSMRSRGYGLKGRTAYSNYRFDLRDRTLCIFMVALICAILVALATKVISVQFFPSFSTNELGVLQIVLYVLHGALCFMPLVLNLVEDATWRTLKSKI